MELINIKDRLPEYNTKILLAVCPMGSPDYPYFVIGEYLNTYNYKDIWYFDNARNCNVLYWAVLPSIPQ